MELGALFSIIAASLGPSYIFLKGYSHKKATNDWLTSLVLIGAQTLATTVVALAATLYLANRIDYKVVFLASLLISILTIFWEKPKPIILFKQIDHLKKTRKINIIVLSISLFFGTITFNAQFQYASSWGDIGVYLFRAEQLAQRGHVTFTIPDHGVTPLLGVINPAADNQYQTHALPTWPALMAMFTHLGITQSPGHAISAFLLGFSILQFFVLTTLITKSKKASFKTTIIFSTLPLLWHQTLYETTEILSINLTISALLGFSLMRRKIVLAVSSLLAFGCVHIGLFLYLPILLIICTYIILKNGSNNSKINSIVSYPALVGISTLLALIFSYATSAKYTNDIINGLLKGHVWIIWILSILFLLLTIFHRKTYRLYLPFSHYFEDEKKIFLLTRSIILVLLLIVLAQCYILGWTDWLVPKKLSELNSWSARSAYVGKGWSSLLHLSMFNLVLATSAIGILAFFCYPWLKIKKTLLSGKVLSIWIASAYAIFIFGVNRIDIPNNYYASRYFLPVAVPLTLLLLAYLISKYNDIRCNNIFLVILPIILFFSGWHIGPLLNLGFFSGDREIREKILANLSEENHVILLGSQWLDYFIRNSLWIFKQNTTTQVSSNLNEIGLIKSNQFEKTGFEKNIKLVTDEKLIIGGLKNCIDYTQRRIPWQILYPRKVDYEDHRICIIQAGTENNTKVFGLYNWLIDGKLTGLLVAPNQSNDSVTIEIESSKAWESKKPFDADIMKIAPDLKVCGQPFILKTYNLGILSFVGKMKAPFCDFEFKTKTFIPEKIGEGTDTRQLGMDISSIRLVPN